MRRVIYHNVGLVVSPGVIGQLYKDGTAADLLSILEELIEESKDIKGACEIFTAWDGLKYQRMSILNSLYLMGYNYVDKGKKDMHVKEMRGRFTEGNLFYLQIKTSDRSYVTLQSADSPIGQKKPASDLKELNEYMALYDYTRTEFLKGVKKSETRVIYSSATIARTLFNRKNKQFSMSSLIFNNGKNVELEKYFRPACHSGYNDISPQAYEYKGDGIVLDVNSLYDYIAYSEVLPTLEIVEHGEGEPDRKYIRHKNTYYTFMKVEVSATLKENGIPCIQPDGVLDFAEYLTEIKKRVITLSEADRQLLFENYDIKYYRIKSYYVFRANSKQFKSYIAPLYDIKKTARKNSPERDFAKSMMVGFLGTFGKKPYKMQYLPVENKEAGYYVLKHYALTPDEYATQLRKASGLVYLNIAIVSGARRYIIHYIKKHADRWLYTDTDSIHLKGTQIPSDIPISEEIGDFKVEHTFTQCSYKAKKNYIIVENNHITPIIAGLPTGSLDSVIDAPGIDTKKVTECLKKKRLDALYEQRIGCYRLIEDLATLTINYEKSATWLKAPVDEGKVKEREKKKTERERKAREWRDTNITVPEMLHDYKEEKEAKTFEDYLNRKLSMYDIRNFDEAMACVSVIQRQWYIRQGYFYSEKTGSWWKIEAVG